MTLDLEDEILKQVRERGLPEEAVKFIQEEYEKTLVTEKLIRSGLEEVISKTLNGKPNAHAISAAMVFYNVARSLLLYIQLKMPDSDAQLAKCIDIEINELMNIKNGKYKSTVKKADDNFRSFMAGKVDGNA